MPNLTVAQIRKQLRLAVNRVMAEGSLYDPDLATLALKQARGGSVEAVFLIRAFRTTLPRLAVSSPPGTTAPLRADLMKLPCVIFAKHRQMPHHMGLAQNRCKMRGGGGVQGRDFVLLLPIRQGEVEPQFLHDIGIVPFREQRLLSVAEPVFAAAGEVFLTQQRAEPVEVAHQISGGYLQSGGLCRGHQCQKPPQRAQYQRPKINRRPRCGPITRGGDEIPGFCDICQPHWRLQRAMQPVARGDAVRTPISRQAGKAGQPAPQDSSLARPPHRDPAMRPHMRKVAPSFGRKIQGISFIHAGSFRYGKSLSHDHGSRLSQADGTLVPPTN